MGTFLLSFAVTPLAILFASALLSLLLYWLFWRKHAKRLLLISCTFSACVLLHIGVCLLIANHPVIVCPSDYSEYITDDRETQIRQDVKDLYQNTGLLFPAVIEIKYADEDSLKIHIQYLFYGTVDFSIDADQTKSIDKPLY